MKGYFQCLVRLADSNHVNSEQIPEKKKTAPIQFSITDDGTTGNISQYCSNV